MQDLSRDMEDLMRRASEEYPLKQGKDRWGEVASGISQSPGGSPMPKQRGSNGKLYSLLFLLVMVFCYLILSDSTIETYPAKPNETNNSKQTKSIIVNHSDKINVGETMSHSIALNTKFTSLSFADPKVLNKIENHVFTMKLFDEKTGKHDRINAKENLPVGKFETEHLNEESSNRLFQDQHIEDKSAVGLALIDVTKSNQKKAGKDGSSKKGFYYGIVSGIHLNTIKGQEFEKTGFALGLAVGYRFNSTLSLESGLLVSKKFYWTRGDHFNMTEMEAAMPSGMEMIEVHGSSRIIEIPLHLRYDFSDKANHRFYASTGFSSYIMTKEDNQYHTMLNGTDGKMTGSYSQDRRYFAASFDMSMGYEKDLGVKSHIRVEPFLQLPIRGIGIGQLPVRTAGLRLSLTGSAH